MKKLLSLLTLLTLTTFNSSEAATVTLAWDSSAGATTYKLFESTDGSIFSNVGVTSDLTFTRTANVTTYYYVTAANSAGESGPSEIVNYVVGNGLVTIDKPTLSLSSMTPAQTLSATAIIHNGTSSPFIVAKGVITARRPGATNTGGPFDDFTGEVTSITVAPGSTYIFSGNWTVPAGAPTGQWRAHLAVQNSSGVWTDGPDEFFTVTSGITVPDPPTNFRVTGSTASTISLQWDVVSSGESVLIDMAEMSGSFHGVTTVAYPKYTYTKTGLKRTRLYYFRARRKNAAGTSGYTATIAARTK